MAIGTAAALIGGASALGGLAGGMMQGNAAKDAAAQQSAAADRASKLQYEMYQQSREDQEPWRKAGVQSLSQLSDPDFQRDFTAADFTKDPGYDFRMAEGQKALERSAAAKGGLQSGGTLKALARYSQDYGSGEYNNAYNRFNSDRDRRFGRLSSIAGMGQNANNSNAQSGMNYANQVGQNYMGAANTSGAAGIAGANGWANSLSGIARAGMDAYSMNNQQNWMDKMLEKQGG